MRIHSNIIESTKPFYEALAEEKAATVHDRRGARHPAFAPGHQPTKGDTMNTTTEAVPPLDGNPETLRWITEDEGTDIGAWCGECGTFESDRWRVGGLSRVGSWASATCEDCYNAAHCREYGDGTVHPILTTGAMPGTFVIEDAPEPGEKTAVAFTADRLDVLRGCITGALGRGGDWRASLDIALGIIDIAIGELSGEGAPSGAAASYANAAYDV